MLIALFCFLFSFVVTVLVGPFVIKITTKLRAGQNILEYVESHKSKQGTPTMCGTIFIIGTTVSSIFAFTQNYTLALMTIITMLAFGCLGFLDDFIKVKSGHNEGLKPYQKIIGQLGISIILAFFVYNFVGSNIVIPFINISVDIGLWVFPLVIITILSLVNAVNLLDGLDGLASGVSIFYLIGFTAIISLGLNALQPNILIEHQNLITVCFCLVGALTAFEIFNGFPAKVFMGDTGSLAIGGFLSTLAVFTGLELYVLILGLPYVITALSDIIQVAHYKRTKKRVFLMAPLHHHFEKKGIHENKIVLVYMIITILIGVITYVITKIVSG